MRSQRRSGGNGSTPSQAQLALLANNLVCDSPIPSTRQVFISMSARPYRALLHGLVNSRFYCRVEGERWLQAKAGCWWWVEEAGSELAMPTNSVLERLDSV